MKYFIVLLLTVHFSFSQEWSKIKLNDFSSISFPKAPKKVASDEGIKRINYSLSFDHETYYVMLVNLGSKKITTSELPKFYQGIMKGTLKSSKGKMISQKEFNINGLLGYEMVYESNSNPQLPNLRHKRLLITNNTLISYEFWTYKENEKLTLDNKTKFFNSIVLTNKEITNIKKTEESSAYKIGHAVGEVIGYLLPIGLLIGGILFFKKKNRKKHQYK